MVPCEQRDIEINRETENNKDMQAVAFSNLSNAPQDHSPLKNEGTQYHCTARLKLYVSCTTDM
jgi:hypothetical protein